MNERMRIVVDIDGVACAHAKAICSKVKEDFDLSSSVGDVLSWDHDFGPITFVEAVRKYYPLEGFVLNMETTPGFRKFLQEVACYSSVSFATARRHAKPDTVTWIKKHFGSSYEVVFVSSKSVLDSHVVIDDSEKEIVAVAKRGCTAILYTQPWNDHPEVDESLGEYETARRVRSFQDILGILNGGDIELQQLE